MRRQFVGVVALGAAALLLGCGSSGSSTAPSHTAAVAQTEVVLRADAICKQAYDRIAAAKKVPAGGQGPPFGSVITLLDDELPILGSELSSLRQLQAPGAASEAFAEYVRAVAGELAAAGRVREASVRKDASGYRSGTLELLTQSTRSIQAAGRVGLAECAKKPEPQG